ncbi:hypothetical protein IGI04_042557 [Brassica rapa subsp. trilocularis]|uniref:Uncharacterized protein n=1 Tax=Brassica rapa subsp. trilocularis TaxID=1813537 RepID=A0ABQ7KI20_BRACM|nr:hypothetical protein IGI04_042557 [Brassica rapa subsp. trilocularis]
MKGLEFLQVKERTAACAESAEAAGQLSPLSLALTLQKNLENFREKERKKNRKISEKIRKINQETILGDLIFNPRPVCCFEKDQKLQAYHGEEDQLRPSSPLVRLAKVWSFARPILSIQSLGKPQSSESDELLSPFSFVQEELKYCPSQFEDCSLGESRQMLR